jgi:hypothetical protein
VRQRTDTAGDRNKLTSQPLANYCDFATIEIATLLERMA